MFICLCDLVKNNTIRFRLIQHEYFFHIIQNNLLQNAEKDIAKLKESLDEIDTLSKKMADHFCEEESKFKLEECLDVFKQFCDKVKQCQQVSTVHLCLSLCFFLVYVYFY